MSTNRTSQAVARMLAEDQVQIEDWVLTAKAICERHKRMEEALERAKSRIIVKSTDRVNGIYPNSREF